MSREAYQPPTSSSSNPAAGSSQQQPQASGSSSFALNASGTSFEDTSRPVQYLCGDCDSKVSLKKGDAIMCKACGYRVLYKERTNRMLQFEAR